MFKKVEWFLWIRETFSNSKFLEHWITQKTKSDGDDDDDENYFGIDHSEYDDVDDADHDDDLYLGVIVFNI